MEINGQDFLCGRSYNQGHQTSIRTRHLDVDAEENFEETTIFRCRPSNMPVEGKASSSGDKGKINSSRLQRVPCSERKEQKVGVSLACWDSNASNPMRDCRCQRCFLTGKVLNISSSGYVTTQLVSRHRPLPSRIEVDQDGEAHI
jgi:hypothetical protein